MSTAEFTPNTEWYEFTCICILLQEKYQKEQDKLKEEWEKAQREVEEEERRYYEEVQGSKEEVVYWLILYLNAPSYITKRIP